jgi:hypothetical protein
MEISLTETSGDPLAHQASGCAPGGDTVAHIIYIYIYIIIYLLIYLTRLDTQFVPFKFLCYS